MVQQKVDVYVDFRYNQVDLEALGKEDTLFICEKERIELVL